MKQIKLHARLIRDKSYRRVFILAVSLPFAVLIGGLTVGLNSEFFAHLFPPCPFKLMTGYNCISCGATRATLALLHGHLLTAIYYNPLYLVFLFWVVCIYLRLVISLICKPYQKYSFHFSARLGIAAIIAAVAFVIIRNMHFYQTVFY